MNANTTTVPAGIQYAGEPGISKPCIHAITRLIQHNDRVVTARILSCDGTHCLLLKTESHELIAVKSGFGSGYRGEGSRSFSYGLVLLEAFNVDIDEYDVGRDLLERLDQSALTAADMERVDATRPVRPTRWRDYVFAEHSSLRRTPRLGDLFKPVIPFSIIDYRLVDLAISFWDAPDDKLLTGYRRLEDAVRSRTGIDEHGSKLFARAFRDQGGILHWQDIEGGELAGRISLFTGIYQAYRNPRAHREFDANDDDFLSEFLLLNHLYVLEANAMPRQDV